MLELKGISKNVSNEQLLTAMNHFGRVEKAVHLCDANGRSLGTGHVWFKEEMDLMGVFTRLDETPFFLSRLVVSIFYVFLALYCIQLILPLDSLCRHLEPVVPWILYPTRDCEGLPQANMDVANQDYIECVFFTFASTEQHHNSPPINRSTDCLCRLHKASVSNVYLFISVTILWPPISHLPERSEPGSSTRSSLSTSSGRKKFRNWTSRCGTRWTTSSTNRESCKRRTKHWKVGSHNLPSYYSSRMLARSCPFCVACTLLVGREVQRGLH